MAILNVSSAAYDKIGKALYYTIMVIFVAAVAINILYQLGYLLSAQHMIFFEPDNYEYYLFAKLAIAHPGLTPSNITNPYLIGGSLGFFEHPGLYLMPVYLYSILHLPLVW